MNKDKARIAELELQLRESEQSYRRRLIALCCQIADEYREAEQFARDVAHKLDMPYAPPVAKGDCAYLAALEALKERAEAAEADAARLRSALEKVEWDAEWGDCLWCNRNRNQGHAPTCARQAALHGEQEGAAKEGEGK